MRRLILLSIFFINFSVLPSNAADNVIIDRVTQNQAEELDLTIPESTPPGFHSIEIEVYDDKGSVSKRDIPFCKNLSGEIHWNNKCPDVVELQSFEELQKTKTREKLPAYSPAQEPNKSKDIQVAAFAALAALAASNQSSGRKKEENSDSESDTHTEKEDLTSVDTGDLQLFEKDPGWGDFSLSWDQKYTASTDFIFRDFTEKSSKHSPLLARTIADGNYLRAMLGSIATFLLPISLILGLKSLINVGGQALVPELGLVLAIVAIGVLDAFAGLCAGIVFFLGVLLTGHLSSRHELLTVLGVMVIFYAPALVASAVRPLRRLVTNRDLLWERITDYALAILLTCWAVEKMVGALNSLAGIQLAITFQAKIIAIFSAVIVGIRIALEDVATYYYPVRLQAVSGEFSETSQRQRVASLGLKTFVFFTLAAPFVGYTTQLFIGTALFIISPLVPIVKTKDFPKVKAFYYVLPKGVFKIVVMVFVGFLFSNWVQGLFTSPKLFLQWNFVILTFPGLILSILGWFSAKPDSNWRESDWGRRSYRLLGVCVFLLLVQLVRGANLTAWIQ